MALHITLYKAHLNFSDLSSLQIYFLTQCLTRAASVKQGYSLGAKDKSSVLTRASAISILAKARTLLEDRKLQSSRQMWRTCSSTIQL